MDDADGASRGRLQAPLYGPPTSAQRTAGPEIEHGFRNSLAGQPLYDAVFPAGDSPMRTKNLKLSITFADIPPSRTIARAMNDPVTVALEACVATKVATRHFRMLSGARELEIPFVGA